MTRFAILATTAILAGCCTTLPPIERTTTVEVKVPVSVPIPAPKEVVRPSLMISQLTAADKTNPGKVIQYYQASIKQLQGYAAELEAVIDGYRPAKTAPLETPSK